MLLQDLHTMRNSDVSQYKNIWDFNPKQAYKGGKNPFSTSCIIKKMKNTFQKSAYILNYYDCPILVPYDTVHLSQTTTRQRNVSRERKGFSNARP